MDAPSYFPLSRNPLSPRAAWPADEPDTLAPPVAVPETVLHGAAKEVAYQGVKNKVIALSNMCEIAGHEKRAITTWLRTQTPTYTQLVRQAERLVEAIERRKHNKQNLKGTLAPQ